MQIPHVTMASDDEELKTQVQLGLRDTLMDWGEQARLHFRAAVELDPDCAMAWAGLLLTEGATAEVRSALERSLAEEAMLTPQETAVISIWLRLAQSGQGGAGDEFAERAERYRHDVLSACWAVRLLHDGYEEIGGKPLPSQQRALKLAQSLYERWPDNPLVVYMRAWVEESSPTPSDEAMNAAKFAAEVMCAHPATELLYGHLLYRKGQLEEAILHLHQASTRAGECRRKNVPCGTHDKCIQASERLETWPLELRAKLYESTLLWLKGQHRESLTLQSELLQCVKNLSQNSMQGQGEILLFFEAQTLPLRLLMLSPKLPSDAQVAAATKAAQTRSQHPDSVNLSRLYQDYRDCLRFCVVARQRAAAGRQAHALRCIKSAEACAQRIHESLERDEWNAYTQSALTRADEACQLALLAAKAAAYPDSSELWVDMLEKSSRRSSLLMPPVLPSPR